eukprot:344003-Rhodomonas_salina.1
MKRRRDGVGWYVVGRGYMVVRWEGVGWSGARHALKCLYGMVRCVPGFGMILRHGLYLSEVRAA